MIHMTMNTLAMSTLAAALWLPLASQADAAGPAAGEVAKTAPNPPAGTPGSKDPAQPQTAAGAASPGQVPAKKLTTLGPTAKPHPKDPLDKPDPDLATDAAKQAVKQRVDARWGAVLKMDFDSVYEFATPAYRAAYGKAHFFNQYGGQVRRTGAEVRRITFENPQQTQALVLTAVGYFMPDAFPGYDHHGEQLVRGHWMKQDGEWWRVESR